MGKYFHFQGKNTKYYMHVVPEGTYLRSPLPNCVYEDFSGPNCYNFLFPWRKTFPHTHTGLSLAGK